MLINKGLTQSGFIERLYRYALLSRPHRQHSHPSSIHSHTASFSGVSSFKIQKSLSPDVNLPRSSGGFRGFSVLFHKETKSPAFPPNPLIRAFATSSLDLLIRLDSARTWRTSQRQLQVPLPHELRPQKNLTVQTPTEPLYSS